MKKPTIILFAMFSFLAAMPGFSQEFKLKAAQTPNRESDDSRFSVEATIMDNDTWCRVEWPGFYNYDEIAYDDGEANDYFIFSNPGSINANKFTPWFYPAEVTGGEIYVGNASFPGPFLGTLFRVMIFDDDGTNGLPGTVLDSMDVTVQNYYWVEFAGMSAIINSGNFFLGMKQLAPSPDAAPIGVDTDNPTYYKSYSNMGGSGWVTSPLQDFMIRAWIASGNNNGNVDYYQIDRFSNFDPNGSPLLGDTTFLENRINPYYNDHDWASLPMGWYAYGVKEHYIGGGFSDYNLSNIVGHFMTITVTINVSLCDTLWWEYTVIRVNGEDVPATLTPDGAFTILEFNTPPPIQCDIMVYCPGNEVYSISNTYISDDMVFNIPLMCIAYPVRNVYVDPVSMIAAWEAPQVVPLEQNFEGTVFPPSGWQMQSQGNGWFRTEDGSGGGWNIPGWNSNYACTNDLLFDGNDGSMDYLATPVLHLDYRPDYVLNFDNYFDGASGQSAYIEYTTDGEDWEILYEIGSSPTWENIELSLVYFSGPDGPPQVSFAFHADDNGQDASGWAVDNVRIYSPDPPYTLEDYWVFINDSLFAITDTTFIDLSPLTYGEYYTISVKANYPSGFSIPVTDTVFCEFLYPPSCFYQEEDLLLIACPPVDTNGNIPQHCLGLNLYMNMDFLEYISFVPEPPPFPVEIVISDLGPGIYTFMLKAVYDLAPYGFPGETGESGYLSTEVVISYGLPLPFLEQWNSGTFETNSWLPEGGNWSINWQEGQPGPSAEFTWDPIQADYSIALESYPLLTDSLTEGSIYLDFDLKLDNFNPTGNEQMLVQVWNWISQEWSTASIYSNEEGSFDWLLEHLDITDQAIGNVFKIRFLASGENSLDLIGWYLDNIHVYRECNPPRDLEFSWIWENNDVELTWAPPLGTGIESYWIHWDDGMLSANSIGGPLIFDVAARWDPDQLSQFDGGELIEIAFAPYEAACTYHVRAWVGTGDPNMVIDQIVENPVIGQWNYITLVNPLPLDVSQDLWVGYHINAYTGYPAGVDDGPAIDGYGNMVYFGGWSTLLEINPELDYNWNIQAKILTGISDSVARYAIYRMDEWNEYFLRGYSEDTYFYDDSAICQSTLMHCYKVTAIYESNSDFCESNPSNEVCDVCEKINEEQNEASLLIYPNPASDILHISSSEKIESISIYNSRGEEVKRRLGDGGKRGRGEEETLSMSVSDLVPGLYLVRVEMAGGVVARKVVVTR